MSASYKQPNPLSLPPVNATLIGGVLYVKEADCRRTITEAIRRARAFDLANLPLINAAPDLLAAAKLGLARIESDIESAQSKTEEGDALRAAIKKAMHDA